MSLFWIALVATAVVGVGTYLMRASFILVLADRDLPAIVRQGLRYVAPAVMAALVVSLGFGGETGDGAGWIEITALVAGGVVGWRTRSLTWVLVVGMSTLWLLQWLT